MINEHSLRAARAIDGERLWRRHAEMAKIGATQGGGSNRQALSPEDAAGRALLLGWARARGYAVSIDPIGNLFVRRPGTRADAAPVLSGSHLDTQPLGGRFDGVYGVLAALEVMEALDDSGIALPRPVELVVWTNEEGSRFAPVTMGSAAFAGALPLESVLATKDAAGLSVADALAETAVRCPVEGSRSFRFPVHAYLEAHIEQGPVLEAERKTIGVVSGIQGLRWYNVEVTGETAHAGTTPRARRKDALRAAIAMVTALEALTDDVADAIRFTVGRVEVRPNSPNTVPDRVLFTIDLRHTDAAVLDAITSRIDPICQQHRGPCAVRVTETINSKPTAFDRRIVGLVRAAAESLELSHRDIVSGATHDAKYMAPLYPSGMIFVPCERGVSHSEIENATPEDLAAGARVLAACIAELALE